MNSYQSQAAIVRALAHPVRLQILQALADHPACVCELQAATGRRQAYVSQQLSILRAVGLVSGEKEGLQVRYRLTWPDMDRLLEIIRLVGARRLEQRKGNR